MQQSSTMVLTKGNMKITSQVLFARILVIIVCRTPCDNKTNITGGFIKCNSLSNCIEQMYPIANFVSVHTFLKFLHVVKIHHFSSGSRDKFRFHCCVLVAWKLLSPSPWDVLPLHLLAQYCCCCR